MEPPKSFPHLERFEGDVSPFLKLGGVGGADFDLVAHGEAVVHVEARRRLCVPISPRGDEAHAARDAEVLRCPTTFEAVGLQRKGAQAQSLESCRKVFAELR